MSKHTPGPWARYGSIIRSIACNDRKIADVRVIDDEGQANSILIVASPDMLVALEGLLDRYTSLVNCGDCGYWNPEAEEEVIASRAAIAKARGLRP